MASRLLAFDCATEHLSIALGAHGEVLVHEATGGAQASSTLIPAILALLARAGTTLAELDAIAFGRGPGAFTGLRTACAVAQGLAFGSGRPVLPVDTLLAVAEDARAGQPASCRTWAMLDARMREVYAAEYAFDGTGWRTLVAPFLATPEDINRRWTSEPPACVAGTALDAFGSRLATGAARRVPGALPRAAAMLPLARALLAAGGAVDPALALPLYLRDKVAQTSAERAAAQAAEAGRGAAA